MKTSNNIELKDKVSLDDKIKIINTVVNSCFLNGEYTPYYKDYTLKMCFGLYVLSGIEFEENEDIAELIEEKNELSELWRMWKDDSFSWELTQDIDDIVDYKKKQLLNENNEINKYLIDLLREQVETVKLQKKVLEQADKINGQYSKEDIMRITEASEKLSDKLKDIDVQKGLVQSIKKPTDHKRAQRAK
jgi:predicted nucleotidyltransferase